MTINLFQKLSLVTLAILPFSVIIAQSPTSPALGFNVFVENDAKLSTNETEGPLACGGNLIIAGNYQVAIHSGGNFAVDGKNIGLLIGGKVVYQSGNQLQVNQNSYIKIGNSQGSYVWYYDQNNAPSPIRITPTSNYNSSPLIMLQANANQLGVNSVTNPIFQSNLIDFASAFSQMRQNSLSLSQCTGNVQLTNMNGQTVTVNNLPNQIKVNLQNGVNYLNIKGSQMNSVQVFNYNQAPSASRILVINVDAEGEFTWNVWNQTGINFQNCNYVIYNFYNTTKLNIGGNPTIEGSVFAPFADIIKTVNQSNIQGQVIGKSIHHAGGEMHYAIFEPSVTGCAPVVVGTAPNADFDVNNNQMCLVGNEFTFNNTSSISNNETNTYHWDFGNGDTSSLMNPTYTYSQAGNYNVTLTATNQYGSTTKVTNITVLDSVGIQSSFSSDNSYQGSITYNFSLDNSQDFQEFHWFLNNETQPYSSNAIASFTFTEPGYHIITINGIDFNGCPSTKSYSVVIETTDVNTGNQGGLESESLGDLVSKRFVQRKKNSIPTDFVKTNNILYSKVKELANYRNNSNNLSMLEMFPSQLNNNSIAHISSPTDILDYTIAEEVLSVDFSISNNTKAVVLGVKTTDKVYNHTKASCDRLRGAEILDVKSVEIDGYQFLMQAIKQRNGVIEHAISFVVGKDVNDTNFMLQTNWFVKSYQAQKDMFNFQVWATNPEYTQKLVLDILNNVKANAALLQTEEHQLPIAYASKIERNNTDLLITLKGTNPQQVVEFVIDENYSETNGYSQRYLPTYSDKEQVITLNVNDGYEYDGLIKVNGITQDAFYHADGNWGLDFDSRYTTIQEYTIYNDFDRVYEDDEMPIHRNVSIKAHSLYDYLTLYKALLPGSLSADYSDYGYLSFKAKGSGPLEISLIKSSLTQWKHQYKANINVSSVEKTYYIPFSFFKSTGTNQPMSADDLTMITFTFLPVVAGTNDLDLTIEDLKLTKTAPVGYEELLVNLRNEYVTYPNPSNGSFNVTLYADAAQEATLSLRDITGKLIIQQKISLEEGRNDLNYNFNLPSSGIMFLNISNNKIDFGTSKLIIK